MIHIKCQHHRQNDIARIDRDETGYLQVFVFTFDDVRSVEPKPGRFERREGTMPLEGPWMTRWTGTDGVFETACERCGMVRLHPLPLDWLTGVMHSERDAFVCPCPVLPSGP